MTPGRWPSLPLLIQFYHQHSKYLANFKFLQASLHPEDKVLYFFQSSFCFVVCLYFFIRLQKFTLARPMLEYWFTWKIWSQMILTTTSAVTNPVVVSPFCAGYTAEGDCPLSTLVNTKCGYPSTNIVSVGHLS